MVEALSPSTQNLRREILVKRQFFPHGKAGRDMFCTARESYSLEDLQALRQNFGPGQAGLSAFRLISIGTPCEVILDPNEKTRCGGKGIGTIDFDVVGSLEQVVFCNPHREKGYRDIQASLQKSCPTSALSGMGFNGLGRF